MILKENCFIELEKYYNQSFENLSNLKIEKNDIVLDTLCVSFLTKNDFDRQEIKKSLNDDKRFIVVYYAFRCAVRALLGNRDLLINGIIALSIEDFVQDPRDSIAALILILHSSNILNEDIRSEIKKIVKISSESTKEYFEKFLKRENIDIRKFGFEYMNSDTELGYKWIK